MYKNKLNNMEDNRLPKIASKSSHNHHGLKRGWHKDARSWLNYRSRTFLRRKKACKEYTHTTKDNMHTGACDPDMLRGRKEKRRWLPLLERIHKT
jgi:hypothetical protein